MPSLRLSQLEHIFTSRADGATFLAHQVRDVVLAGAVLVLVKALIPVVLHLEAVELSI